MFIVVVHPHVRRAHNVVNSHIASVGGAVVDGGGRRCGMRRRWRRRRTEVEVMNRRSSPCVPRLTTLRHYDVRRSTITDRRCYQLPPTQRLSVFAAVVTISGRIADYDYSAAAGTTTTATTATVATTTGSVHVTIAEAHRRCDDGSKPVPCVLYLPVAGRHHWYAYCCRMRSHSFSTYALPLHGS